MTDENEPGCPSIGRWTAVWRGWGGLVILFSIVTGLWLLTWFLLYGYDDAKRGTFGDMFGSINALFSGLAFAGVIYAIFLQKDELSLQRRELEMTRDELRGQKDAMLQQQETMDRQRFENTFFHLLRLHRELATSIEATQPGWRVTL